MGKPRHRGDVVKSQNTGSPGSPQGWQKAQGAGCAGIQNHSSSRSCQGAIPSQHPRSRASLPPPRSQLLFKGAFLGTLLRERAPGRKRQELLPSGCRQTQGTGSTFCNSSKIGCTSQPVRPHTQHPPGSQVRLRDPGSFPSAGCSYSQGWNVTGAVGH